MPITRRQAASGVKTWVQEQEEEQLALEMSKYQDDTQPWTDDEEEEIPPIPQQPQEQPQQEQPQQEQVVIKQEPVEEADKDEREEYEKYAPEIIKQIRQETIEYVSNYTHYDGLAQFLQLTTIEMVVTARVYLNAKKYKNDEEKQILLNFIKEEQQKQAGNK